MNALGKFSDKDFARVSGARVESIERRLVYFLHRGRNAWHSTWTKHYFPGCVHVSRWSARSAAEPLRAPGSVFYIDELPVILIGCNAGKVAIVDVDNLNQFSGYTSKFMLEFLGSHRSDATEHGRYAISVSDLVSSFAWHGIHYMPSNIFAVATDDVDLQFAKLPRRGLWRYRSYRDQFGDLEWAAEPLICDVQRATKVIKSIRRKLRTRPLDSSFLPRSVTQAPGRSEEAYATE
jgi:hypothetical protein